MEARMLRLIGRPTTSMHVPIYIHYIGVFKHFTRPLFIDLTAFFRYITTVPVAYAFALNSRSVNPICPHGAI